MGGYPIVSGVGQRGKQVPGPKGRGTAWGLVTR